MSSASGAAGAFRCQRCGAPLEVTPETIVAVCPYCGFPNWTVQAYVHPIELVAAQARRGREFFERYLSTDRDMVGIRDRIVLKSLETIYVPVYFVDVAVRSHYRGRATVVLEKIVVKEKGEVETKTRMVTVYVEGDFASTFNLDVVARRFVDETVLEPLIKHYRQTRPTSKPIGEVNWDEVKGTVLSSEIPPDDAGSIARDRACEQARSIVESRMRDEASEKAAIMHPGWTPVSVDWEYKRIPCRSRVTSISPIILIPYILAVYAFEGKHYKTVFAGWDGTRVYGEEPITSGRRTLYFTSTIISSLLAGAGIGLLLAGVTDAQILGGLLMAGAGVYGAYSLAGKAVADVRIEEEE